MSNKKHIRGLGILAQLYRADEAHCVVSFGPTVWLVICRKKKVRYYDPRRIEYFVKEGLVHKGYHVTVTLKGVDFLKQSSFAHVV